jgi:hypothetical protein
VPPRLCCACISFCFHLSLQSGIQRGREGAWNVERGAGRAVEESSSSSSHLPICPPCRSCPGCTRAASCRLTHGPGRTDRQTAIAKMPRRFYITVHVGVSFPFLSFPSSCHFIESFSPYGPTIDSLSPPPICETEFAIVCKSRASMQRLTVQSHSPR